VTLTSLYIFKSFIDVFLLFHELISLQREISFNSGNLFLNENINKSLMKESIAVKNLIILTITAKFLFHWLSKSFKSLHRKKPVSWLRYIPFSPKPFFNSRARNTL